MQMHTKGNKDVGTLESVETYQSAQQTPLFRS